MICFKLPNGIIINKFAYKFISCSNIESNYLESDKTRYYFKIKLYSIYEKKVEEILFESISAIDIGNMHKEIKEVFQIKY